MNGGCGIAEYIAAYFNKWHHEHSIDKRRLHKNVPAVFATVIIRFHAFSKLNKVLI